MVYVRFIILFGAILGIIFPGCEKTTPREEKAYGDSLVIVTYRAPTGLNPLTSLSGISAMLAEVIFDGLVKIDENLETRASLASSWEVSDDKLRWTFFLKKGVKFHDEKELTSEDVKFTIEHLIHSNQRNPFSGGLSDIKSISIRDRYTLDIFLKRHSIFLLYSMNAGIVPAHLLKSEGSRDYDFGRRPVGTGPFKVAYWGKEEIILEANRDYFSGRPYLEKIVVKVYPNQELSWAKLMRGEGDIFWTVDPAVYEFLEQVDSLKLYRSQGLHYSIIALNSNSKLFEDRRIRLALNYAINKEHIVEDILRGKGVVATGTIWPGSWAYHPTIKPFPYNPTKALSLINEAGWKDMNGDYILDKEGKSFSFTLLINEGDKTKRRVAMYIQQQLWELGIIMEVKALSPASIEAIFKRKFDAGFFDIFSHVYPDFSYNFWHSSQIEKGLNMSRYRSDRIDRLLEKGRSSKDKESARLIYYRFQQEIRDNPPGVFLYWADRITGVHTRFRGVKFPPVGTLAYISEWYVPDDEQKYKR